MTTIESPPPTNGTAAVDVVALSETVPVARKGVMEPTAIGLFRFYRSTDMLNHHCTFKSGIGGRWDGRRIGRGIRWRAETANPVP